MLFVRRRLARSALAAALLATTFWLGDASAQSAPKEIPATDSPSAADATTAAAPPDWSGQDGAKLDRVVLKPPDSTRWWLIGAGLATTTVWYGASYGIGALWPEAPGHDALRIPVAGPFIDLAKTGCPKDDSDCSTFQLVLRTILVSLDAIGQAGGVGLLIEGAVYSPSGVEPARSAQRKRSLPAIPSTTVMAVPMPLGQSGAGLGLVGRF